MDKLKELNKILIYDDFKRLLLIKSECIDDKKDIWMKNLYFLNDIISEIIRDVDLKNFKKLEEIKSLSSLQSLLSIYQNKGLKIKFDNNEKLISINKDSLEKIGKYLTIMNWPDFDINKNNILPVEMIEFYGYLQMVYCGRINMLYYLENKQPIYDVSFGNFNHKNNNELLNFCYKLNNIINEKNVIESKDKNKMFFSDFLLYLLKIEASEFSDFIFEMDFNE